MKICIIDFSAYAHRSFAVDSVNPIGMIRAIIDKALITLKPDHTVMALDASRETFRNQLFPAYKANRPPSPPGYAHASAAMAAALVEMGIKSYSAPNYESDDIIGTLCARKLDTDSVLILSRDKDFCQLVTDDVNIWYDGKLTGPGEVVEKFGVRPSRVVEVMGLMGDSTDGIPGVAGIGIKVATELIQYFQDLEGLYDNLPDVEQIIEKGASRIRKKLEQSREIAFLSRKLATIRTDVPLGDT